MSKFNDMNNQLNQIIDLIQGGDLDIDESIKKYQEASKLIIKINEYLKNAENKLSEIKIDFPK